MSNMLYACSILYKMKLPMTIVFNKIDIINHKFAIKWMTEYESFHEAISKEKTYSSDLASSLGLVLDEFYNNLSSCGVSAVSGEGMDEFFEAVTKGVKEYEEGYKKELEEKIKEKLNENKNENKKNEKEEFNTGKFDFLEDEDELDDYE
jgi:GPN-loop GTPase